MTSSSGSKETPQDSRALLAVIPDPVIRLDERHVVRAFNPAARLFLPLLKEGQPLSFAFRAPDVLEGVEQVLAKGGSISVMHIERLPQERAFDIKIVALDDEALQGAVLVVRDVTAARRLDRMRVDFIANASHELRTPLASMLGFVETLQGPARHDEQARDRFLGIMRDQALRMTRLIDDLLSLSRIEMKLHIPPDQTVDLVALVRHVLDTLGLLAREKNVSLNFQRPTSAIVVPGDRDELIRLVENLVENAVKYGENGGQVEIGIEAMGAEILLRVSDDGPGIAPQHLPRLTERFYRADIEASRARGGTGLGLAIVKHIVNRHRGRLLIESELGKGARFKVFLPL